MDKKLILLEAVQRLLALRVPENEIILNLAEVGISNAQARQLIAEAKRLSGMSVAEKEVEKDSGRVMMDVAEKLAETKEDSLKETVASGESMDDFLSDFPDEKEGKGIDWEQELGTKKKKKKEKEPDFRQPPLIIDKLVQAKLKEIKQRDVESKLGKIERQTGKTSIERLWEKGILTTVNQRLNEMKALKADIDARLSREVQSGLRPELEKIRVSFESQRALMVAQMEEKLEEKFREAGYFVEQKIVELKAAKNQLEEVNKIVSEERKKQQELSEQYEEKMKELSAAKNQVIAETNSELIKAKSSMQAIIDSADAKVKEIDERVNRTLELEASIAQGLAGEAEEKISEMVVEKTSDIRDEMQRALADMRRIKEELQKSVKAKLEDVDIDAQAQSTKVLEQEVKKMMAFREEFEKKLNYRLAQLGKLNQLLEKEAKKGK